jgi:hypothetical protein
VQIADRHDAFCGRVSCGKIEWLGDGPDSGFPALEVEQRKSDKNHQECNE